MVVLLDADTQNFVHALLKYCNLDVLLVLQNLVGGFEEQTEETLFLMSCGPYFRER